MLNRAYISSGTGYSYNSDSKYKHYYTEVFSNFEVSTYPIVNGWHDKESNVIEGQSSLVRFFCQVNSKIRVRDVNVVIDKLAYSMSRDLGERDRGNYILNIDSSSLSKECSSYYFFITDSFGNTFRFPETSKYSFLSFGINRCKENFSDGSRSTVPSIHPSFNPSAIPSVAPSPSPSIIQSTSPSIIPSAIPSIPPSVIPSFVKSTIPSIPSSTIPSIVSSAIPSKISSLSPTVAPSVILSTVPSASPSEVPSTRSSTAPSTSLTAAPSSSLSKSPSIILSTAPSTTLSTSPSTSLPIIPSLNLSVRPSFPPERAEVLFAREIEHPTIFAKLQETDNIPLGTFQLKIFPMDFLIDLESLNILNTEMDKMIQQASVLPNSIRFTTNLESQALLATQDKTSVVLLLRKVAHLESLERAPSYENSYVMRDRLNFAVESCFNSDIKLLELKKRLLFSPSEQFREIQYLSFEMKKSEENSGKSTKPLQENTVLSTDNKTLPIASKFFKWILAIFGLIGFFFSTLIFLCRQKKISFLKSTAPIESKENTGILDDERRKGIENSFIKEKNRDDSSIYSHRRKSSTIQPYHGSFTHIQPKKSDSIPSGIFDHRNEEFGSADGRRLNQLRHARSKEANDFNKPRLVQLQGEIDTPVLLHSSMHPFMMKSKQIFDDALQAIKAAEFGDAFVQERKNSDEGRIELSLNEIEQNQKEIIL
eukprot:CAMPEP_0194289026 /NCGR_PEP_ID=MMETSP0169-20130528/38181_1 /TAXON_ID=218684 /ORGANISM="Corethron pennatum, Strain L29A3" /LENGTH=707 /DNA_ID=CAMNT_0039036203 /DNA_START=724 /DNA_END=2847 /DNA_ORIENTATION=+